MDWEAFETLIDEASDENRELLEEFLSDARMRIQRLLALQSDLPAAAAELHQLKGSSSNFGFEAFRSHAAQYELSAKNGEAFSLPDAALELQRLLEASIGLVKERMPGFLD